MAAIRAAALEGGAFAFLTKPFDDETFLALVRQALGSTVRAMDGAGILLRVGAIYSLIAA